MRAGAESELADSIVAMRADAGFAWIDGRSDLLDGLTAEERRAVVNAVADNVLEGWRPGRAEVQALVDVMCGRTSTADYIRSVCASFPVSKPAT